MHKYLLKYVVFYVVYYLDDDDDDDDINLCSFKDISK